MSRIFVVGGAGYIGSHCCKALAEAGFEPVVYDNLSTGHAEFVRWGKLIEGDIRDGDRLAKAVRDTRPEAVMHFAGLVVVKDSIAHPEEYFDVNVAGGLCLLDAMLASDVNKIIFSSTCAVYGEPETFPISETAPTNPVNPYGGSKLAFERMLAEFDVKHGLKSVCLRYFNAAGADPGGEVGEWRAEETHLIPLVIMAALGREPSIRIFGSDYATPDGTAVRDYIHVTDLADAHLRALDYLQGGGGSDVFNLGTGVGTSVAEIAAAVERASGCTLDRSVSNRRPGDPPTLVASAEKARGVLGWTPAHSDIDNIIRTAWHWHSQDAAVRSELS